MPDAEPDGSLPALPRVPLPPVSPNPAELGPKPLPDAPPAFLLRFGLGLRRALLRLADRVTPAHIVVMERSIGLAYTTMLAGVTRAGIAELLEPGPLSAAELCRHVRISRTNRRTVGPAIEPGHPEDQGRYIPPSASVQKM